MSTPSITPSFQIYQFSWIQLNTFCAPPKNFFLYRLDFWQLLHPKQLIIFKFSPWNMLVRNLQHHSKLSNKQMKLNSAKYLMCAPRVSYLLLGLDWISDCFYNKTLIICRFSPWYMLVKNLQHHSKLSK